MTIHKLKAITRQRFGGLWRHPDFMRLWTGQTISQFGSRITREGLPLVAVLVLSASPGQMGLLAALASVPAIVLGLFAGVLVDRMRRRPIMIVADLGRFVLLLGVPIAALTGHLNIGLLYALVILTGILTLFFDIAYQSVLPSLVSRENLIEGNSKLAITEALAEIGGPTLAGTLVTLISAPVAICFDAVSFLVSAISLALIRAPEPPPAPRAGDQAFWADLKEGWRVILDHPALRTMAFSRALRSFFGNFYAALYSLYIVRDLHLPAAALGIAISAGGIGGLVGAVAAGWLPKRFGLGRTLTVALLVGSLIALLTPLAGGPPLMILAMLVAAQFFGDGLGEVFAINELTFRQITVNDHLLGRANATTAFLSQIIAPLGALTGGFLAEVGWIGARGALLIAVLGWIVNALWVLASPVRDLQHHTAPDPDQI